MQTKTIMVPPNNIPPKKTGVDMYDDDRPEILREIDEKQEKDPSFIKKLVGYIENKIIK